MLSLGGRAGAVEGPEVPGGLSEPDEFEDDEPAEYVEEEPEDDEPDLYMDDPEPSRTELEKCEE
jgi:hypothetical protein